MDFPIINAETETLERLHSMNRYSQWIYNHVKPFIQGRVLEVGCGIGAMTRHLVTRHTPLVSIDVNQTHVKEMEKTYLNHKGIDVFCMDILSNNGEILAPGSFDTILLINVLEHIDKESETLQKLHSLLAHNGHFILLVPAYQWLYGTLDKIVGHHRRYHKKSLVQLLQKHGFDPVYTRYMNVPGIIGWLLNGKILKKTEFSVSQILFFEKLIPFIAAVEKIIPPPIGQSILLISKK